MSVSLNKIIIAGNLTRDPEIRYTPGGAAVCQLGIASNRRWTGKDGQEQEEVCFADVEAWGKTAENCNNYLRKGASVLIEGRLKYDSWDDRETGKKRSRLTITAEYVHFMDSPNKGGDDRGTSDRANTPREPPRRDTMQDRPYKGQGRRRVEDTGARPGDTSGGGAGPFIAGGEDDTDIPF